MTDDSIRINKFLALHGGYSRREADMLVEEARVKINDKLAELGSRVNLNDLVFVDGRLLEAITERTYLAFYKPRGYVSSRKPQGETPTIYSLIPKEFHPLKPVGRLDKDTSGLLLLTDDGDFAHHMTHPKFYKRKIYQVKLDQPLQPLHRQMIADFGIMLDDGKSQFEVERLKDSDDFVWQLVLHEGRNRQIRRTFSALGYTVVDLHRSEFGPYRLEDLAPGELMTITLQ